MAVFVTVGTTSFDKLIESVTSESVLKALKNRNYEKIILQIGRGKEFHTPLCSYGLEISHFRYKNSIQEEVKNADLIISHSGAGSVLEALEAQKPLIVVINEDLMDNHQTELAQQLSEENYLFFCTCRFLQQTIEEMAINSLNKYFPGEPLKFKLFLDKLMHYQ